MQQRASYQETAPPADLRDVVACLWVRLIRAHGSAAASPVLPDGCADVMVRDTQSPIVAGPDAITRWVTIPDGTIIVGVRLKPGGVRAVFGCAATTIVNREVQLSDLVGDTALLRERLRRSARSADVGDTSPVAYRHAVLVDWVRDALARTTTLDADVRIACRLLTRDPSLDVGAVAQRFGWNTRTIRRHFHAACGYGPKHFQRIMRVQRALRESHNPAHLSLADIALVCGYADQSHMTRDFRDITGFTPGQQLRTTPPEFGVWLSEGW